VPATEVDANGTGFVVARPISVPATKLTIFTVKKNLDGTPNITTTGKDLTVPSYTLPPAAPQSGTAGRSIRSTLVSRRLSRPSIRRKPASSHCGRSTP
jgi:hypothetical protein